MSIRIQNDVISGNVSPDVNRAGGTGQTGAGSGPGSIGSGTSVGGDQVTISSAAETLSSGISAGAAGQSARVRQLGALYANGQYSVDAGQVSRALINNSISGAGPA